MPRRVSLPGASELFRPTTSPALDQVPPADEPAAEAVEPAPARRPAAKRATKRTAAVEEPAAPASTGRATGTRARATRPAAKKTAAPAASGRVRHDEKITVYVSREELLALETGRLALRGEHDLAVDRGRIVRESIALAMEDLAAHGADSELVRRLLAD